MKRAKLYIGLLVAGALTAGLGTSIVPAAAQQRVITATLVTGQSISVTVPGERRAAPRRSVSSPRPWPP